MILLYYLVIRPLSFLPSGVLYVISDWILYPVIYEMIGYRKKLVLRNLTNSFPEKSSEEIMEIARQFYHHFCDLIVESIMIFQLSREEIIKRGKVTNPELLQTYFDQGRSVCLTGGHYNNWEMLTLSTDMQIPHQADGIYTKLQSPWMDRKINASRSRYGMRLVHKKKVAEHLEKTRDELTATIFATDQSPKRSQKVYWTKFLGQDTATAFGAEKYSREYDWPVIYGHIAKIKRGHYTLTFELISEHPASDALGAITQKHTAILEKEIQANPEYWLWTHNRWKLKKETLDASL